MTGPNYYSPVVFCRWCGMRLCALVVVCVSALFAQPPVVQDLERIPKPALFDYRRHQPDLTSLPLQAGGPKRFFWTLYQRIGQFTGPVIVRASGLPPEVSATVEYHEGPVGLNSAIVMFYAGLAALPGEYSIRIVAEGGGEEHELALRVVVEAPATNVTSRLLPPNERLPVTGPAAAVEGHKSVMLVLGMDDGMGMEDSGCDVVKQIAQKFHEGLQPGRDALGILESGTSVRVALPLTTDFDADSRRVTEESAQARCTGSANTLYALERAHEQLKRADIRGTERVVVVAISDHPGLPLGTPTTIVANWPILTQADSRGNGDREEYAAHFGGLNLVEHLEGPSHCLDIRGRRYPDPDWATGDSMPDRTGVLQVNRELGLVGPLEAADRSIAILRSAPTVMRTLRNKWEGVTDRQTFCGFSDPGGYSIQRDLAYLPETDLGGVPLDGPRPLVRFTSGPYKGKIRPDSWENATAALENLFDRIMRRLDDDGIRVIVLYVNPYLDERKLGMGLGGTSSFDAAKTPVTLLTIHDVEQVPYILENIWATLGRTRR
jgi:hypothetical protein